MKHELTKIADTFLLSKVDGIAEVATAMLLDPGFHEQIMEKYHTRMSEDQRFEKLEKAKKRLRVEIYVDGKKIEK